ncbi:response regulator transcription factor [bacterium SCSIO 12741]|nr:response regulator transcription factor [bacterium SCSIO 12741]
MTATKLFRTLIVDDEPDAVEVLESMIQEVSHELEIVGRAHSIKEAEALLRTLEVDLVFLDIQMPGGTGFDLLKRVQDLHFHTVFVSAYANHAIDAIKFHALAYILKPVAAEDLKEALQRVKDEALNQMIVKYDALLQNLEQSPTRKIAIPTGKGYRYFEANDIIRVEASKNYSNVFTTDSETPILVSKNLKQFENFLSNYGFLRIHHGHLINPFHVKEYVRQEGGSVQLSDGLTVYIGQSYRQQVLDRLSNLSHRM